MPQDLQANTFVVYMRYPCRISIDQSFHFWYYDHLGGNITDGYLKMIRLGFGLPSRHLLQVGVRLERAATWQLLQVGVRP